MMELLKQKSKALILNRNGLSLLELIISIAIIAIGIVVITPFFGNSAANLVKSGTRTKNTVELQGEIGKKIKNHQDGGTDEVMVKIDGFKAKNLKGIWINVNKEELGEELTTFVPNKSQ